VTLRARVRSEAMWIDLLRTLTEGPPTWLVWKNVEAGLAGEGDVDFLAPEADWDAIEHDFLRWARDHALGPVVVCRHVAGAMFLVALPPQGGPWVQLDVRARVTWRGATVLDARAAHALAEMDERGFRRLRPGAEGLIKLFLNGVAPGGRRKDAGLAREGVIDLLGRDPAGVERTAALFGLLAPLGRAAARAATTPAWPRAAMAALEGATVLRAALVPTVIAGQARARRAKARCPVLRAGIEGGRRVPGGRDEWLVRVARSHIVHDWLPPDG
jgi:hypothetical protein